MPGFFFYKSALTGRFFILGCLLSVPLWVNSQPADDLEKYVQDTSCKLTGTAQKVTLKKVIDGDTVILSNDEHVRLIGINTPEIGRDGQKSQIGADQARYYLNDLYKTHREFLLLQDDEAEDHYGRTLAHLFLKDGTNLQALMLTRGLATPLVIPPNLDFLECYEISSRFAQQHHIGLWALKQYQPHAAETLTPGDLGYRMVTGTVMRVGDSKSAIWLNLTEWMALRIVRADVAHFDPGFFKNIAGKKVTARGMLYYANGQLRMQVRHPADLAVENQ